MDIVGLDVAVDDAVHMGVPERVAKLKADLQRLADGQSSPHPQDVPQGRPLQILHRDVVPLAFVADFVDRDDVGMAQIARRLRLAIKPLDPLAPLLA